MLVSVSRSPNQLQGTSGPERSTALVAATTKINPPIPLTLDHANQLLAQGDEQILMEEVVALLSESRP